MKKTIALVLTGVALIVATLVCSAQDAAKRIQRKAQLVEQTAKSWMSEGRDPESCVRAVSLMQMAKQAFDAGNREKGEGLIDRAMQTLGLAKGGSTASTSASVSEQPVSTLYANPQPIEIIGYDQDAMEPCVSLDGKYLFFNNTNEKPDTHIYFARRVSDTRFQYIGQVPGTKLTADSTPSWNEREMAPSLDRGSRFYYSDPHTFAQDQKTLYVGLWKPEGLQNVESVKGDIYPHEPRRKDSFWLDMDCGISPDGNTLVISRAKFSEGLGVPAESHLLWARRGTTGEFAIDPRSDELLKTVNSGALQYAPGITDDGLELYFTRAQSGEALAAGRSDGPFMCIMVARRSGVDKPFGAPARLVAIDGFVEAPSLTLDKRELYFHKKDGKLFRIYRVTRGQA